MNFTILILCQGYYHLISYIIHVLYTIYATFRGRSTISEMSGRGSDNWRQGVISLFVSVFFLTEKVGPQPLNPSLTLTFHQLCLKQESSKLTEIALIIMIRTSLVEVFSGKNGKVCCGLIRDFYELSAEQCHRQTFLFQKLCSSNFVQLFVHMISVLVFVKETPFSYRCVLMKRGE